ncbi:MAG: methyltransferase family protein [Thermoplasmata archaeon]
MLDLLTSRIVAGILLLPFISILLLVRYASSRGWWPLDPVARREEGALGVLWPALFLIYILIFPLLGVILPQMVYGTVFNVAFPGDTFVQVAGLILFASGSFLTVYSGKHLGRFMVGQIMVAKDHELITTGPYARVRHPTYAGGMLLNLSAVLIFLNLLLVPVFLATVALANHRARLEEELLSSEEGFGSRYREYMNRTGRFFPKLRGS